MKFTVVPEKTVLGNGLGTILQDGKWWGIFWPKEKAVFMAGVLNGLTVSHVLADWLEERGHKEAADDIRNNF